MNLDLEKICKNATNSKKDNFVGIKYLDDNIEIYFPLGYNIPKDYNECRRSIIDLIKVIGFSKVYLNDSSLKSNTFGKNNEFPMNSYIWILNDFLKNGIYHNNEKKYKTKKNGKINWKKTLNSDFFVSNNSAIFFNPYVETKQLEDNIITDIHAYCINCSIKYIGWLFGDFYYLDTLVQGENIEYYISIINNELIHSFDDHKKQLLINIKKILEESSGNKNDYLKDYGTYEFEHIWEYMVNKVYGNDDVNKYFPSGYWFVYGHERYKDSNLRPDTILRVDNDIYVIDSKYYKFGITNELGHLPSTDSIQKQITYAEYIENNKNIFTSRIYNAFVLPYNKMDNKFQRMNNIEYLGFSESDWKQNVSKTYERIALILVDTKYLFDCYLKYEESSLFNMISSIQEILNTFKGE